MKCEACERGDHDNCGMQTWCDCDCEGYDQYIPAGHYFADDLDGGRLGKKTGVFTHCNVCGCSLPEDDQMGMCDRCAREPL
jgi:hypothetical protein